MTVGETLSRARRERGLSVDDVAAATRIRATIVSAIEADRFDLCGGTVYARGHIRSIARVVGADAEALIGEYDTEHNVERVVSAIIESPTDHEAVSRSERRRPNWTVAMAAALVVICGLALYGLVSNKSGNSGSQQNANSAQQPGQHRQSPPSTPPPSAVAKLPSQNATMLVRTLSAQTWLSITTKSGKTLFSGLLPAGQHKLFSDKHGLAYVIGNAPAVDLVVNGNDIGTPPSSSGVVARGTVVPGKDTVQQA